MKLFEHWLHYSFDWKSLGLALLIVVISIVLVNGIVRGIFHQIEKRIPDRFAGWTDVLMAFENPARVIVFFTGLLIALHTAHAPHLVTHFAHAIYRSVLMFSIGYGLYKLMGSLTVLLGHLGSRINFELDSIVMPFLTRSLQFVVMALTVTMILSDWGINVNGVFAGLGLAGLAISMAAQDPIKNLLGGIIIITEKPFQIGDWIKSPSVEGIAEDITFRSTLVRTFDGALVIVPNATLSNEPITNWSRMDTRKLALTFYLDIATKTKDMMAAMTDVEAMLAEDDRFETGSQKAYINQVTTRGHEFMATAQFKMVDGADWAGTRADINMKIIRILAEHDIQLSAGVDTPTAKA